MNLTFNMPTLKLMCILIYTVNDFSALAPFSWKVSIELVQVFGGSSHPSAFYMTTTIIQVSIRMYFLFFVFKIRNLLYKTRASCPKSIDLPYVFKSHFQKF